MKEVSEKIKELLNKSNIDYKLIEHEAVFTSEQAAKARNSLLKEGAKSMILKGNKEFYDFVLSAEKKIDWKKVKNILNTKDISLATPQEVLKITQCEIGSVPPFGNLFNLKVICDPSLLKNEFIEFNAGLHTISIRMKARDWQRIVNPQLIEFAN